MDNFWLQLLVQFGVPTVALAALAKYHVFVVKKKDEDYSALAKTKDEEIKRLNEARLSEKESGNKELFKLTREFNQLQNESNKTLALIAERMDP